MMLPKKFVSIGAAAGDRVVPRSAYVCSWQVKAWEMNCSCDEPSGCVSRYRAVRALSCFMCVRMAWGASGWALLRTKAVVAVARLAGATWTSSVADSQKSKREERCLFMLCVLFYVLDSFGFKRIGLKLFYLARS